MVKRRSYNLSKPSAPRAHRACDYCKAKKAKCDGNKPCRKCNKNDQLCLYSTAVSKERKVPPGYVDILEYQQRLLTITVRKLYNQQQCTSSSSQHDISIHEILEELGLLNADDNSAQDTLQSMTHQFDLPQLHSNLLETSPSSSSAPGLSNTNSSTSPVSACSSLDPTTLFSPGSPDESLMTMFDFEPNHLEWLSTNDQDYPELSTFDPITDLQVQKAIVYLRNKNGARIPIPSQLPFSPPDLAAGS